MEPLKDRQVWQQALGIPPQHLGPPSALATQKRALSRSSPRAPAKQPGTVERASSHGGGRAVAGQQRNARRRGTPETSSTSESGDGSVSPGHSSTATEGHPSIETNVGSSPGRTTPGLYGSVGQSARHLSQPHLRKPWPAARSPWRHAPGSERRSSSRSTSVSSEASSSSERAAVPANVSASTGSVPSDGTAVARAHESHHEPVGEHHTRARLLRKLARREPLAGQDLPAAPQHPDNHPSPTRTSNGSTERKTKRKKKKVYCGNNRFDPSLRVNGGTLEVGTRSACMRAGFGAALYQHVPNEQEFINKFSARYAPLIEQKLFYKDGRVPEGYQPATLSQARLRGWGAGSAELARRLRAKRRGVSDHRRAAA